MYSAAQAPAFADLSRWEVNRAPRSSPRMELGVFGVKMTTAANRYPGTACPAGQGVTSRERVPRSPKFSGDKTYDDFVFCKPVERAAAPVRAPRPVAAPVYTTTISPTFQQAFTPQISPTIQVTADSPGAQVGASTRQDAPGGQQAEGGGSGAGFDQVAAFLEQQAATAAAEREQQRIRDAQRLEQQRTRDLEVREQQRVRDLEARAREDRIREELQIERDAAAADVIMFRDREAAEAARKAELEPTRMLQPMPVGEPVFIPAPVSPGARAPTPDASVQSSSVVEAPADGDTSVWVWVAVGAGVLLLVGGGVLGRKKVKATRRARS